MLFKVCTRHTIQSCDMLFKVYMRHIVQSLHVCTVQGKQPQASCATKVCPQYIDPESFKVFKKQNTNGPHQVLIRYAINIYIYTIVVQNLIYIDSCDPISDPLARPQGCQRVRVGAGSSHPLPVHYRTGTRDIRRVPMNV